MYGGEEALRVIVQTSGFVAAAMASCVCRDWHRAALPTLRFTNPLLEAAGAKRVASKSKLATLLDLPVSVVAAALAEVPHTLRVYRQTMYESYDVKQAIGAVLRGTGGLPGLAARLLAKEQRQERGAKRKRRRDECQRVLKSALAASLAALELKLRADSDRCAEFIDSSGTSMSLTELLQTMLHMHYLHVHTNGAYQEAIENEVEALADHKGHFPGMYRVAAMYAQERFPPLARYPWLDQPTNAAIEEAVEIAVVAVEREALAPTTEFNVSKELRKLARQIRTGDRARRARSA